MSIWSDKVRVGILRGGPSPEYEVSLGTGGSVLQNISRDLYHPVDILVSKDGAWHEEGRERDIGNILKKVDVIFNCLHGAYGEDGTVQKILDQFQVPYTGSGALSSSLGMNKIASRKIYAQNGLKIPFGVYINGDDMDRGSIRKVYEQVPGPLVVKPSAAGSSVGVRIVHSLPELEEAMVAALEYSPSVLVEEYIDGKEATCGVVDEFRGLGLHALMPIEIRPRGDGFFDYQSKYSESGGAEEICPGNFSAEEKRVIEEEAALAHQVLGLRHYSRSDFRVHPKRGVFILETNTLPGLTKSSLLPKSLSAAGTKLSDFIHHIINLALR